MYSPNPLLAHLTIAVSSLLLSSSLAFISPQARASDATARPSVTDFFTEPEMTELRISPNGKSLALLTSAPDGRKLLMSVDISTRNGNVIANFANADVHNVHWVNNERIVFSLREREVEPGNQRYYPGLYAVNRDGGELRKLVEHGFGGEFSTGTTIKRRQLPPNTYFHSTIENGTSSEVYVEQIEERGSFRRSIYNLQRLNTLTGQAATMRRPGITLDWLIDRQGIPRVATTLENDVVAVYYKDGNTDGDEWRKLFEYQENSSGEKFTPTAIGPDGMLYVTAHQGKDTRSLYRYDPKKNAIQTEPVVSLNGYDFRGDLIFGPQSGRLLGIQYETDGPGVMWFDDEMKKLQKDIDTALPGYFNRILVSEGSNNVVVVSVSDTEPGMYSVYDKNTGKPVVFGRRNPKINLAKMANKDPVSYAARDGLKIPAYLTVPKGSTGKNLPMILMVHGGPNVRGVHWEFDREVQFLASRGYAVLEPEFRGSKGYGTQHEQAGWKQWGLKMQDDLVDGVKWAVAQGIADPKRVCIAGASYGGYATLMGLIRDPELFQCGISWAAVSDINLMFANTLSDSKEESEKYWMPTRIGDPVKDAEQFKATSPLQQAARLKLPLLLAHGGQDRRVPIEHAHKMHSAIKTHNKNVEWIEYINERHGWAMQKNNIDFWNRVEAFLDKYNPAKAAKTTP